jgi:hypothetical protein
MKVLVTGGSHPNEMQATEIWKALKGENRNHDIIYHFVPFYETVHGSMNKFLKALLSGEIERRADRLPECERIVVRKLFSAIRKDLGEPSEENVKAVENFYERELVDDKRFIRVFPEYENSANECVDESYRNELLKRTGSQVGVDIHNSPIVKGSMEPYIFTVPKKYSAINELPAIKGYTDPEMKQEDEDFYAVEVPADFTTVGFRSKAITMHTAKMYFNGLYRPSLPLNAKNFEHQKEVVKEIIDTIASQRV